MEVAASPPKVESIPASPVEFTIDAARSRLEEHETVLAEHGSTLEAHAKKLLPVPAAPAAPAPKAKPGTVDLNAFF